MDSSTSSRIKMYLRITVLYLLVGSAFGASFVDIGNLPATVSVFEDITTSTFLHSLTSYPTSATCSISAGDTGSNFQIASSGGVHRISTVGSPTFDHANTPSYTLTIQCVDSPSTSLGTLTVNIVDNIAPTFTNLPGTVTVSAKTVKANHVIFTISYTDNDTSSPLTYSSVTVAPVASTSLFTLANDQLTVTSDLLTTTELTYNISFSVGDERTTSASTITVTVTDINYAPDFVLPLNVTLSLPEDKSGRLMIYDIGHVDANADSVQYTYQTVAANNSIFDLVGATGEIFLIHGYNFDYESVNLFTFKVLIADYLAMGTATFTLTLSITNVNERPTFTGTPNNVTVAESAAGTTIGTLSTMCTDVDGDTLAYSIVFGTYTSYFTIPDNSTPTVAFTNTWDYDSTLPTVLNLTIRCSDPSGFSDDTIYTIEITDINDNDPICTPSQTVFNLLYNQAVNETLLSITCTDADSAYNSNLTFSPVGLSSGYTVTYFDVNATGTVFIKTSFTMDFNTTFYVTILVTDRGSPARSDTITLTVTFTMEPTIIIHKEITRCFFCTTGSLVILAAGGFIIFILLCIVIYLLCLRLCFARERKKIIRSLQKKKKKKWRWCGCLRPGHRNKPKRSKAEIRQAELRDLEYMRARNALRGKNDPAYLQARNAMLAPETEPESYPIISPGGRAIPSKLPQNPSRATSQFSNKRRSIGSRGASGISVISGRPTASLIGRDKAPSNLSAATGISENQLTESQRDQLDKFREMKNNQETRKNSVTESSARQLKGQAANEMVWSFQGR